MTRRKGDSWVPYMARCLTPQFATSAHRASSCWCTGLWSQKVYTDHKFPAPPGAALGSRGPPASRRLPAPGPSLGPGDCGGQQSAAQGRGGACPGRLAARQPQGLHSSARRRATASRSLLYAAEEVGLERWSGAGDGPRGGQQRVERGKR